MSMLRPSRRPNSGRCCNGRGDILSACLEQLFKCNVDRVVDSVKSITELTCMFLFNSSGML